MTTLTDIQCIIKKHVFNGIQNIPALMTISFICPVLAGISISKTQIAFNYRFLL